MITLLEKSEDTRCDPEVNLYFISAVQTITYRPPTLTQASLMHLDEDGSEYCTLLEAYSEYEDYDEYSLKEVTDYSNYDFELVLISKYTYTDDIYSIPHKYNE